MLRLYDVVGVVFDESVVEVFEGFFVVGSGIVVYIGIVERVMSDGVVVDMN